MDNIIVFNISNGLSLFRFFLSIPLAYCLLNNLNYYVLIIAIVAYITDILDGFLARKLNQITEFGKVIDPLADKIFIMTAVVTLLILDKIPLWFMLVIIARDLLILIGGFYASLKLKYVIPSNFIGKITVIIIGLTIIIIVLDITYIKEYSFIVATFFSILSLIVYFINMRKLIKNLTKI